MSDHIVPRTPSNASSEPWPRTSLAASYPHPSDRDAANSRQTLPDQPGHAPASPTTGLSSPRPSLQNGSSRRTSLSNIPSYTTSTAPASSIRGSLSPPSLAYHRRLNTSQGLYRNRRPGSLFHDPSLTSSRRTNRPPAAMPENDFLGFCKGAWKLQNGDRKGAMEKHKESQPYGRSGSQSIALAQHLRCSQAKCTFRSSFMSTDGDLIYEKIIDFPDKGIRLRWMFLAMSHVPLKVPMRNHHAFKCLFCVYGGLGGEAIVCVGVDYYIDHISKEHRGQVMGEFLMIKTGCINDHVAAEDEDFEINLWPLEANRESLTEQWLSDGLLEDPPVSVSRPPPDSAFAANEPWTGDASKFDDFDSALDDCSEDGKTIATAIYHPQSPRSDIPARLSYHESSGPSSLRTPPLRNVQKYTYEPWEDDPEEIWGPGKQSSEEGQGEQLEKAPQIPTRSHARILHNRGHRPQAETDPPRTPSPRPSLMQMPLQDSRATKSVQTSPDALTTSSDNSDNGVTTCLKTISDLFNESTALVQGLRKGEQLVQENSNLLHMLEESVGEAPNEIDRDWERSLARYGTSFESGDYVAIMALYQVTTVLYKLIEAIRLLTSGKPTDISKLIDAADASRLNTRTALHDLRQRLSRGPVLPSLSARGSTDATTTRTSLQESSSSNSQPHAQPRQYVAHMRPDIWKDPYFPDKNSDNTTADVSSPAMDSKYGRSQSDVTGDSSKLSFLHHSFPRPKWSRKVFLSRSPSQSKEGVDVEQVVDGLKDGLKLHQRKRNEQPVNDGLSDIVELDSTPVEKYLS